MASSSEEKPEEFPKKNSAANAANPSDHDTAKESSNSAPQSVDVSISKPNGIMNSSDDESQDEEDTPPIKSWTPSSSTFF